jgi:hypothetical protein
MADAQVRVIGAAQLTKTLRAAEVDLDELKKATDAAGRIVLAAAVAFAPKRSGALAGTGRKNLARRRVRITFGNAAVPYAPPIHWGWARRNIAPNPFASRAATATEPVWVAAYVDELRSIAASIKGV